MNAIVTFNSAERENLMGNAASPLNFLWKSSPRSLLLLLWPSRAVAIYFLVGYSLAMVQSEKHLTCLHCEIASVIFHRQANSLACQIYLRARFPVSFFAAA